MFYGAPDRSAFFTKNGKYMKMFLLDKFILKYYNPASTKYKEIV